MRASVGAFILSFCFILHPLGSEALTLSGGVGLGQTQSSNEAKQTEGPLTQTYTMEFLWHSRLSVGAEHIRSLTSGLDSATSFTGALARYYINAAPVKAPSAAEMPTQTLVSRDIAIFVGAGTGLAQSSRLPNSVGLSSNAAGVYLSPRAGGDYQWGEHWGIRAELIYAMTLMGKGSIQLFSLGGAFYWIF